MSVKVVEPLRYDSSGAFVSGTGLTREALRALSPRLAAVRDEVAAAACCTAPERLFLAYNTGRRESALYRLLRTAERMRESVDRVVVLGSDPAWWCARALMEACCDPYFNELSRAERGSRPRVYFEGNSLDNDAASGLLRRVGSGRRPASLADRWALVVVDGPEESREMDTAVRLFQAALQQAYGDDAGTMLCHGGRDATEPSDTPFTAAGLLPASILGIDVVALLQGAITMNIHFRQAGPDENLVWQYAGLGHLAARRPGSGDRVLAVGAKALEMAGRWYEHVLGATSHAAHVAPVTVANTSDLRQRAGQYRQGRRDQLVTHVMVDEPRTDPLPAEPTLSVQSTEAIRSVAEALRTAGQPAVAIHLPRVHESTLGQLLQWLTLAAHVERRLAVTCPP